VATFDGLVPDKLTTTKRLFALKSTLEPRTVMGYVGRILQPSTVSISGSAYGKIQTARE
jgi:hypothetical protein